RPPGSAPRSPCPGSGDSPARRKFFASVGNESPEPHPRRRHAVLGTHRRALSVTLSRNPSPCAGPLAAGRATLELLVSASIGFWLAADASSVFRADRLAPNALRELARRRLSRLLETAAHTHFYGEKLAAVGLDADSSLLEQDPQAVLGLLEPVGKAELREAG